MRSAPNADVFVTGEVRMSTMRLPPKPRGSPWACRGTTPRERPAAEDLAAKLAADFPVPESLAEPP